MTTVSTRALTFAILAVGACSTADTVSASDASPAAEAEADAAASADGTLVTLGKYGSDGPEAFTMSNVELTADGKTWNEAIYVPTSAGLHPVVSISSGTAQPAAAYGPYATRLASYGILVVVADDLGLPTPTPTVVDAITYVVSTYLPASLAATADMKRVGVAGHSRGGKASLIAAQQGLKGKVVAWFGLDPVDVDFLGNPSALPGVPTIGIPMASAGASVSSSCSPASANYEVYFAASSPPSVAITIEGAGHVQFEDPDHAIGATLCTPSGTADSGTVLALAVHYMTAFFARELLGDQSVGPSFDGVGAQADIAAGRIQVQAK